MQNKKNELKGIANELITVILYVALTYIIALLIMR
mgnify:CR=1 FL=1